MAHQSPLISIPKKTTTDVDWSGPIRSTIAQSFGEDPNNYTEELSVLQRCRQGATAGAGSDVTARDMLYKYFGQLELLELRFAEVKVSFTWNDAFTNKSTTQSALAFEKASIIYLLAATLSSLAASGSRADAEGVKRAYFNSRAAAGMLSYISDNFLHAPSTDLSREVIHLLTGVLMAQATEIFTEKLIDEKKSPTLVCRSANSAATAYTGLVDELKEFQGKGVFDRNWLYVLQIKAKLFASLAQYYRAMSDVAAGKHGAALVRNKLADTLAQDASRQASSFEYSFYAAATPSLPSDSATSLAEITKAHATLVSEAKEQSIKDNDLIYHDILPSEAALPAIEKLPAAAPITIQEVYKNPDVSKLIGPDIFVRLVPLAVHESASVYSEEKAKLVRSEVERVDLNEGEIQAALEHLGLPGIVGVWRKIADDEDGEGEVQLSSSTERLARDVAAGEQTENLLRNLDSERERLERELRELSGLLDNESRECERMRAKYNPQFTQAPSGQQTNHFRSTITSNLGSISAAAASDEQLKGIWREIQGDVGLLARGESGVRAQAQQIAAGKTAPVVQPGVSLLDLQEDEGASGNGLDPTEKDQLLKAISDINDKLDRLSKIRREREEVLKDLKDKIQNDDVSNLLLLNRRGTQNVEPQLFATELEKFKPFQGRLSAAIQASSSTLQELETLVRQVEKGKGVKERQKGSKEKHRRIKEFEAKLEGSGRGWEEIKAGAGKGLSFYESLDVVVKDLGAQVRSFVKSRETERNRMVGEIETRQRISSSPSPSVPSSRGLDSQFAGLSIGAANRYASPSVPQPPYSSSTPGLPAPPSNNTSTPAYPPPPPAKSPSTNPYDFTSPSSRPLAYSTSSPAPSQQSQSAYPAPPQPRQNSYTFPSAPSQPSSAYPAPPRPQSYGYTSPPQPSYGYTPPSQPQQHQPQQQQASAPSPYPAPPARQTSSSYYPAPPTQPSAGGYPNYPPPSSHYSSPPPQQYSAPAQQQYAAPQHQYAPAPQHPQQQQQQGQLGYYPSGYPQQPQHTGQAGQAGQQGYPYAQGQQGYPYR